MARPPGELLPCPRRRWSRACGCAVCAYGAVQPLLLSAASHGHADLVARGIRDDAIAAAWLPRPQVEVMVSLGVGQAPPARREKNLSSFMETGSILIESR